MRQPTPTADSTSGCRCSVPPRGSEPWQAPWLAALRWASCSCSWPCSSPELSSRPRSRSLAGGREWRRRPRLCFWSPWPPASSRRCALDRVAHNPVAELARQGAAVTVRRDGRLRPARDGRRCPAVSRRPGGVAVRRPRGHRPRSHPEVGCTGPGARRRGSRRGAARCHGPAARTAAAGGRPRPGRSAAAEPGAPRSWPHPDRGGGPRQRSGRRCATRWRTGPPSSVRWCRLSSTVTTPRSPPSSRTRSGPRG